MTDERSLSLIRDRAAVIEVVLAVARALDVKDWAACRRCFTDEIETAAHRQGGRVRRAETHGAREAQDAAPEREPPRHRGRRSRHLRVRRDHSPLPARGRRAVRHLLRVHTRPRARGRPMEDRQDQANRLLEHRQPRHPLGSPPARIIRVSQSDVTAVGAEAASSPARSLAASTIQISGHPSRSRSRSRRPPGARGPCRAFCIRARASPWASRVRAASRARPRPPGDRAFVP